MTHQDQWTELEGLAKAVQTATKDRPTSEPGGMGCQSCMNVFVGSEAHDVCGICHAEDEFSTAANPSTVLALIAAARAGSVGTDDGEAGGSEQKSLSGEAVAWRWRFDTDALWSYGPDEPGHFRFMQPVTIQPLYTAPSSQGGEGGA